MQKRSDQDNKATPSGENLVSPWRAAKPRRSLRDIAGEPESPKTLGVNNESPPNSSHKESTRLESGLRGEGGLDLSQGASPALSVTTAASKTQTGTFTKLKNTTNSKSRSTSRLNSRKVEQEKNQQGSEEEEDEEEQPAARCQFVGNVSNRSVSQTPDSSWREASARINNKDQGARREAIISRREETHKEGGSLLQWFCFALLGVVIYFVLVGPPQSHSSDRLVPEPLSAGHWKEMRAMVKDELLTLRTHFPNQTSPGFWTLVSATLKAPMHPLPDYPGVLLLLSDPLSRKTANCLASRLVEISSKVLARPGLLPPPVPSLVLPSSSLPDDPAESKQQLTDKLYAALGLGSAVALLDLEKIDPVAALTLHAFADNTNAPFKQAVLVSTLEAELGDCKLEQRAERTLTRLWGPSLGPDKLAALLSRLVVAVAEVHPETDIGVLCPSIN